MMKIKNSKSKTTHEGIETLRIYRLHLKHTFKNDKEERRIFMGKCLFKV